jgi:hypothetical protein
MPMRRVSFALAGDALVHGVASTERPLLIVHGTFVSDLDADLQFSSDEDHLGIIPFRSKWVLVLTMPITPAAIRSTDFDLGHPPLT